MERLERRFDRLLGHAELLLDDAVELVHRAFGLLEVVIREFPPRLLRSSFDLIPLAVNLILVDVVLPFPR